MNVIRTADLHYIRSKEMHRVTGDSHKQGAHCYTWRGMARVRNRRAHSNMEGNGQKSEGTERDGGAVRNRGAGKEAGLSEKKGNCAKCEGVGPERPQTDLFLLKFLILK